MYFISLGPFCFGLFVFHFAPGADFFCLGRNIFVCMYGPEQFGSRSRFFCPIHKFMRLRSRTARLRSRLLFRNELFLYTVWDRSAPGEGFCLYLLKIIVIRPNRSLWTWYIIVSGSFGSALGPKLITYKCLKTLIYTSYFASPLGGQSNEAS